MKYLRSATFGCKDIGMKKTEFAEKDSIPLFVKACQTAGSNWLTFVEGTLGVIKAENLYFF